MKEYLFNEWIEEFILPIIRKKKYIKKTKDKSGNDVYICTKKQAEELKKKIEPMK